MSYRLLDRFRSLFEGVIYRHRNSSLGDSVANFLPEDLYALGRSTKLVRRIDAGARVINSQNKRRGVQARRGDGTFGELIPDTFVVRDEGYVVARGPIATVEIGTEVKILAKAMIKQIDRVMGDLQKQVSHFHRGGGNPICVGIVGINFADQYLSYEADRQYLTDGRKYPHPIQEANEAERRIMQEVRPHFDELLILRFRATNLPPYPFEWVNERDTRLDYAAILTRVTRQYDNRF